MWSRVAKYLLYSLGWALVLGFVLYSICLSHNHRKEQKIESIEISILDSAMYGSLITTHRVKEWIKSSGIKVIGLTQNELELSKLKEYILKNSFVEGVNLYPTYKGTLRIELSQRHPALRLLTDGYNLYTTRDGYIFESPALASLYVPVITGEYSPPFPSEYRGCVDEFLASELSRVDVAIEKIEREQKYPLYEREQRNKEDMREIRRKFIKQRWFESDEAFAERVDSLRAEKLEKRQLYRYRSVVIEREIAETTRLQEALRGEQKKLTKKCKDYMNLVNFADMVCGDRFWGSEIVQIIARQSQSGAIHISFIVRSTTAEIIFGELNSPQDIEQRLRKLYDFYQKGLMRVGWERYKTINIEYKGQVVCK